MPVKVSQVYYCLNKQYFLDLPPEQTITILLDNGYHKDYLEQEIEQIDAYLSGKIRIEISAKITPEQKAESKKVCPEKSGFVTVKKRWIVERTNAWLNQCLGLMKELRRVAQNKRSKNQDSYDSINTKENRLK